MTATLIQPTQVLDLRSIPPRQRHALIVGRFDALATGQALQLVNNHDPQPLREQFEDRSSGQFAWTVLEGGPQVWRVQIARVMEAASPQTGVQADSCCSGGNCCG